MVGKEGQTAE